MSIKKSMTYIARLGLLATSVALGTLSNVDAATYSNIYVFGDSLVDSNNVRLAALGAGFPDPAPASLGYYNGHFTNGPDYTDLLTRRLQGHDSIGFVGSPLTGTNYAFGGAQARNNGDFVPDFALQVDSYLVPRSGVADANGLYVVNFGGNDLFDFVRGSFGDPTTIAAQAAFTTQVFGSFQTQLTRLSDAGARNILVTGLPDVSGSVRIQLLTAGVPSAVADARAAAASAASRGLDGAFNTFLTALDAALPADFFRFDYINFFDSVNADLVGNGLPANLNTTLPCILAPQLDPAHPDCTPYGFFDQVHPEARFQALIANQVAQLVGLPEPATLAFTGLGLVAIAALRRRKSA